MRIALHGDVPLVRQRAEALRQHEAAPVADVVVMAAEADAEQILAVLPPDTGLVFYAGGVHPFSLLSELARRGIHLFLEWPPASSVADCRALIGLSEEAGIEIGVSRPLRFYPWSKQSGRAGHVDIAVIRQTLDLRARGTWKRALEDAVDLALLFARGASARRIDASIARTEQRLPLLTAAGIRFHNGTYVQLELRHTPDIIPTLSVTLAGPGYTTDLDLSSAREDGISRETTAFAEAVAANRPPPVSVLDALQTIRLMEKLMERLRK